MAWELKEKKDTYTGKKQVLEKNVTTWENRFAKVNKKEFQQNAFHPEDTFCGKFVSDFTDITFDYLKIDRFFKTKSVPRPALSLSHSYAILPKHPSSYKERNKISGKS